MLDGVVRTFLLPKCEKVDEQMQQLLLFFKAGSFKFETCVETFCDISLFSEMDRPDNELMI